MTREKPGGYDRVMRLLGENPGATLNDLSAALGVTRERALMCLRYGMQEGAVTREPGPGRHLSWRWTATR